MKPSNTQDIENLLKSYLASAALGTALELGLFKHLDKNPLTIKRVSKLLNIPINRCKYWLALLEELGLIEKKDEAYSPSPTSYDAILNAYSSETWAFLAQEIREGYQIINNLTETFSHPGSIWNAQGLKPPDYIKKMNENPERAKLFTLMLYELHKPLAEKLASILDMTNIKRLMDLGGGSGIVSLELLKRNNNLTAVVVDIENVCNIGREIANKTSVASRITYYPANFLQEELPSDFDMILECDVGVYSEELFRKIWEKLNDKGKFFIISNTNEQGAWITHPEDRYSLFWFLNAFSLSLEVPKFKYKTINDVKTLLNKAGFLKVSTKVHENGILFIKAVK